MTHALVNIVSLVAVVGTLSLIAFMVDDRLDDIVRALRGRPMR